MSEVRQISLHKILQPLISWIVLIVAVLLVFAADRAQKSRPLNQLFIDFKNQKDIHFLNNTMVYKMLFGDRHLTAKSLTPQTINLNMMERVLQSNPTIDSAQVFLDKNQNIHFNIIQKEPVIRVFETGGASYYLDTNAAVIPLSDNFINYIPIASNMPLLHNDSISKKRNLEIIYIAKYLQKHTLWSTLFSEIVYNNEKEGIALVPQIGNHRVLIGDTSNLDSKLNNLLAFYENVLNKIGWVNYKVLDLRFDNQVVAAPPISWKAPVDKALSTMNWVTTIVGKSASEEEKTTNNAIPITTTNKVKPTITNNKTQNKLITNHTNHSNNQAIKIK